MKMHVDFVIAFDFLVSGSWNFLKDGISSICLEILLW